MKGFLKIISLVFILVAGFYFVPACYADAISDAADLLGGLDPAHPKLPPALIGVAQPNLAILTCEVKCFFAGKFGLILVAVTIFMNGILILAEKMSWQMAVLTSTVIISFTQVDAITRMITAPVEFNILGQAKDGNIMGVGFFGQLYADVSKMQCDCKSSLINFGLL